MLNGCYQGGEEKFNVCTHSKSILIARRLLHRWVRYITHQNWLNCQSSPKVSRKLATLTIGLSSFS